MKRLVSTLLLFFTLALPTYSQYVTVSDGNWNTPSTWSGGNVPLANVPNSAYDSIIIGHRVVFENGNVPFPVFLNHLMRIEASGSLTIDPGDTLATGEGLGGIPRFVCEGELHLQEKSGFMTKVGNPTYDEVTLNGKAILADSAFLDLFAYNLIEVSDSILIGDGGFASIISFLGNVWLTGNNTLGESAQMIVVGTNVMASGSNTLQGDFAFMRIVGEPNGLVENNGPIHCDGDSTGVTFILSGDFQNNGPIIGSNRSSMVAITSGNQFVSVVNNAFITNHSQVNFLTGALGMDFQNNSTIEGEHNYFQGARIGTWENDGIVLSTVRTTIFYCRFEGEGNFCSQLFLITDSCDFWGTLDLCVMGAGGIVHMNSVVGPDVTNCQGPCNLVGIEEPIEEGILIYPNPVRDRMQIESPAPLSELKLYDVNHRLVLEIRDLSDGSVDLTALPRGIYFYQISDAKGQLYSGKLLRASDW